jgi:ubiquinone/menaquinone biosynthesis C-methylase UbiE
MPPPTADTPYPLGATSAEHARLIRQAVIWDPFTERLFRDAGIGPGQRVLDIGSGVGDVAMLAARLVGPSGAVIGVERDPATIATARSRVANAGLSNVSFMESDIRGVPSTEHFDAVVGRAILQYLPEAGGALRSLAVLVRPDGVVALQDVWPASLFHLTAHLPLRSKCASFIYRTLERSGVHMDMELVLYRAFLEAGLPAPKFRIEVPVGDDPNVARWFYDLVCTLASRLEKDELAASGIGDLETLESRLEEDRGEIICRKRRGRRCLVAKAWVTRRALLGDGPPTIASVGARTSDRISEPLRGVVYSLSLGARRSSARTKNRKLFSALHCRRHLASAARPTGRMPGLHSRSPRISSVQHGNAAMPKPIHDIALAVLLSPPRAVAGTV